MNNQTGFEVKAEQRQSWVSIAMVWAGGMICVPCLMIGGVLSGGGLSIPQIVASILIGYGLICAYMILIGMAACDTGLPVAVMAEGALGKQGAGTSFPCCWPLPAWAGSASSPPPVDRPSPLCWRIS